MLVRRRVRAIKVPPMSEPVLPSMRVDGQIALVTGAGRGIGKGCAIALAEAGADLFVGCGVWAAGGVRFPSVRCR